MKLTAFLICSMFTLLIPFLSQKKIVVHVTPADAIIFDIQPGTTELRQIGIGTATVLIPKNSSVTIVVQKAGFADMKKVYNSITDEKLPKEEFLTMKDRAVNLRVWPTDAKIILNGNVLENGSTIVIVKDGERSNVEVRKNGYASVNKIYTNQSNAEPLPLND